MTFIFEEPLFRFAAILGHCMGKAFWTFYARESYLHNPRPRLRTQKCVHHQITSPNMLSILHPRFSNGPRTSGFPGQAVASRKTHHMKAGPLQLQRIAHQRCMHEMPAVVRGVIPDSESHCSQALRTLNASNTSSALERRNRRFERCSGSCFVRRRADCFDILVKVLPLLGS